MYILLLSLIYLSFISLGLPDSLLGSAWPVMHIEIGVPVSYMGFITMIISASTIVSSLSSYRLTRKFGTSLVTLFSVFLTSLALFGFSISKSFIALSLFAIPYGLGAGAIDSALNNYVAINYSSMQMSLLHSFWGIGAIISPLVMGYSLTHYNWPMGYRIIGTLQLVIAFILLSTLKVWKKSPSKIETIKEKRPISLSDILKTKGVFFLFLGFFSYCAFESTIMQWASTYLVRARGLDPVSAANFSSLFFIGLTSGRLFGAFIMNRMGDRRMIMLGGSVVLLAIVLLLLPVRANALILLSLTTLGLGCAPIYPSFIHSTPYNFGKEKSAAIIGFQMAFSYVGNTLMPPLYGLLGNKTTFKILPYYIVFFLALCMAMAALLFRATGGKKPIEENAL